LFVPGFWPEMGISIIRAPTPGVAAEYAIWEMDGECPGSPKER
jgi:hypothetical protein